MLNRLPNTNTHLDNERLSLVRAKLELLVKAITKHRQVTDSQLPWCPSLSGSGSPPPQGRMQ